MFPMEAAFFIILRIYNYMTLMSYQWNLCIDFIDFIPYIGLHIFTISIIVNINMLQAGQILRPIERIVHTNCSIIMIIEHERLPYLF